MTYIQEAFNKICNEAKQAEGWYVSLMEEVPFFGGPEEGGWFGKDTVLHAYQWFPTEEQAEAAKHEVSKLAKELEAESRRAFGEQCLCEMELCDRLGVDADWLPEPDGESKFYVTLTEGLPEETMGCRQYSWT